MRADATRVMGGNRRALRGSTLAAHRTSRRQVREATKRDSRKIRCVAEPPALPFEENSKHLESWSPSSWRNKTALQQPEYPDEAAVRRVFDQMCKVPPLVFAGEARTLQRQLAKAAVGEAFVLQGGDCAESFDDFSANHIRDTFRVLLQMSVVLTFAGGMPIVKLGRMAGQFAKPRSAPMEKIGDVELPSYRGDIINRPEFTAEARVPNPNLLIQAYNQSAATLNLLRGFASGGYASMERVSFWNLDFMGKSQQGERYLEMAHRVDEAIQFMHACGVEDSTMNSTEFYTSHEALLMEYEEALTRQDSTTGLWYDCSAHFLWCGERTRQLDGAHIEFLKGVANPLGVKVSHKIDPSELVSMIATLNPHNVPGRLSIVIRMGSDKVRDHLPKLIDAVRQAGQVVTWICDPMHGNTETQGGYKTRLYDNIKAEIEAFFDVHEEMGSIPGGVHLEMTGEHVTECIGGGSGIEVSDLSSRYHTHCDPRLNAAQSLEIAFYVATRLRRIKHQKSPPPSA